MQLRIYCEHGAFTARIKRLRRCSDIDIVHFPYDPDSNSHGFSSFANPSAAQIRDLNLPIGDLPGAPADYAGSSHFREILSILGPQNRRDAMHIDSAFKSGCSAFVTRDSDILRYRKGLEDLLGIRFFHPDEDSRLEQFIILRQRGT